MTKMHGPHWRFAVDVYMRPDVSDACLLLQDEWGVDINVLLISLYATQHLQLQMCEGRIRTLDEQARGIRKVAVAPLRRIRRELKTAGYGADGEILRDIVKKAELTAEQLEQAQLADVLTSWPMDGCRQPAAAAEVVIRFYAQIRSQPLDRSARNAVAIIVGAVKAVT